MGVCQCPHGFTGDLLRLLCGAVVAGALLALWVILGVLAAWSLFSG